MSILKRPGWVNHEIIEEGRLHNDKLKDRIGKMFDRLSLGYSPNHVIDKISNIIKNKYGEKFNINDVSNEYIIKVAQSEYITKGKFNPTLRPSFEQQHQTQDTINQSKEFTSNEPVNIEFQAPIQQQEKQIISIPLGSLPNEDSEDEDDQEISSNTNESEKHQPSIGEQLPEHLKNVSDEELKQYFDIWSKKEKDPHNTLEHIKNEMIARSSESSEEVETCGCEEHDSAFTSKIPKENIKRLEHPDKLKTQEQYKKHHHHESVKLSPQAVKKLLQENYLKQKQHKFKIEQRYGF